MLVKFSNGFFFIAPPLQATKNFFLNPQKTLAFRKKLWYNKIVILCEEGNAMSLFKLMVSEWGLFLGLFMFLFGGFIYEA